MRERGEEAVKDWLEERKRKLYPRGERGKGRNAAKQRKERSKRSDE